MGAFSFLFESLSYRQALQDCRLSDELLALALGQEAHLGFTIAQIDFRSAGSVRGDSFFVLPAFCYLRLHG